MPEIPNAEYHAMIYCEDETGELFLDEALFDTYDEAYAYILAGGQTACLPAFEYWIDLYVAGIFQRSYRLDLEE